MHRLLLSTLSASMLIAVGGCSLFGVATEADLDDLATQEAASTLATQQRLAALEDRMAGIASDLRALDPRLIEMETGVDSLDTELARAQRRLQAVDVGLRGEVGRIRAEMDWVKQAADLASDHSNRALKVQYEALLQERQRLGARVAVLDTLILQWQRDFERIQASRPDTAVSAAPIDTLAAEPRSAVTDSAATTVVDTLLLIP
jgi:septal ring factor EnvC (AmiA/AmiB activator)